jgi:hypothetical protein
MNEQIKKLAEQCYETGPIGKDGWPEYSKFNYKKFAELIVRECLNCIETVDTYDYDTQDEWLSGNATGLRKAKELIVNHFEVKE